MWLALRNENLCSGETRFNNSFMSSAHTSPIYRITASRLHIDLFYSSFPVFFFFFLRLSTYRYGFLLRHIAAKSLTCLSTRWRGISQTSVGSFWWTNKFSKLALKETYNTRWEEFIFRSFDFKKWIGLKCLSRLFFTILSLHSPPSVFQNERKNRKFSFPAINSSPQ